MSGHQVGHRGGCGHRTARILPSEGGGGAGLRPETGQIGQDNDHSPQDREVSGGKTREMECVGGGNMG